MVQISRLPKPQSLIDNATQWTNEIVAAKATLDNTHPKLPNGTKNPSYELAKKAFDNAAEKYDQQDIRDTLNMMTSGNTDGGKCVYCEVFITARNWTDIEHFEPKSLYPDKCYEWDNLLLACGGCNRPPAKGTHDTRMSPIVHPISDNPELYFEYHGLQIKTARNSPNPTASDNTIKVCKLDRTGLYSPLAEVLGNWYKYEQDLQDSLNEKLPPINKIFQTLVFLKDQAKYHQQHAAFKRFVLKNSTPVSNALNLINQHQSELGLSNPFTLDW